MSRRVLRHRLPPTSLPEIPPKSTDTSKNEIKSQDDAAREGVTAVLKEVRQQGERTRRRPSTELRDPFGGFTPRRLRAEAKLGERFSFADTQIGRDYLIVAGYSETFCEAIKEGSDYFFKELVTGLKVNRHSLMMIAITNGLRPVGQYNRHPLAASFPINNAARFQPTLTFNHPHEAFLTLNQTYQPCLFAEKDGTHSRMENIRENIYNSGNFYKFPPNVGWPITDGWPNSWPFPYDPSTPVSVIDRPVNCELCNEFTWPRWYQLRTCTCEIPERLLEVRQFEDLPGQTTSENRGVRALETFKRGEILGEYLGEFIPLSDNPDATNAYFGDTDYLADFYGPAIPHKSSGKILSHPNTLPKICSLMAGRRGNWTRFINHDKDNANVEFSHIIFNGQNRVVVMATRNIAMGEQLTIDYGPEYFAEQPGSDAEKRTFDDLMDLDDEEAASAMTSRSKKRRRTNRSWY